uniref:LamG-like jellyroll fold domain-containing protein n=1 Tax=viral metagenome TaxID=1070528 RepID=A0A6C0KG55_9ZZZZ
MSYATITSGMKSSTSDLIKRINTNIVNFQSSKYVTGTQNFLDSNSLVAKVSFLLLVLIVFMFLLRIGVGIITHYLTPSNTPTLVSGMKDAKQTMIITQNPNKAHSIPVLRSRNQAEGMEFTYSVWLYIDDLQYMKGQYKHIFHKGNDNINFQNPESMGLNFPNNAPGLYVHPNKNALVLIMNTFTNINEEIIIDDVPLNKWINVVIRLEGRNVDVYINGNVALRHVLSDVAKQNYGNIYVNMNGGYSGYLSQLKYYDYALSSMDILKLSNDGPDLSMNRSIKVFPPYFSLRWYFNNLFNLNK